MKKLLPLTLVFLLLIGCAGSPYVGEWESDYGDKLKINDNGTLTASWQQADSAILPRAAVWKKRDKGIELNGADTTAIAIIIQDKLILETQNKVRISFSRQVLD